MWSLVSAPSPCLLDDAGGLEEAVDFVRMRLGSFADLAFRLQASCKGPLHLGWAGFFWLAGSNSGGSLARRGGCVYLPFSRTGGLGGGSLLFSKTGSWPWPSEEMLDACISPDLAQTMGIGGHPAELFSKHDFMSLWKATI